MLDRSEEVQGYCNYFPAISLPAFTTSGSVKTTFQT